MDTEIILIIFYWCTYKSGRIQLHEINNDSHKRLHPDANFGQGVLKIQMGQTHVLTVH